MPGPEDVLKNKNEQNEKINQNPENRESIESAEDMQKRLSQEMTNETESFKKEDIKIETANSSIGLSAEEVQQEKNAMNLDVEINNLNKEAENTMNESMSNLNSTPEVQEKPLSKEELTNLLKNNSLKIDRSTMGSMKWQNPSDEAIFFVPKMTWNENSGVIVFSDESGETYATKSSDELRSSLFKSRDYSKNESIGVPAVNSPDGWKDPKFFDYFWKNKNKESYS